MSDNNHDFFPSAGVLQTILQHRSIRKFTNEPIDEMLLKTLFQAGLTGSSSGFLQSASIIRVTDKKLRYEIRRICANAQNAQPDEHYGHAYVEHCAEFLIFCMDNNRHRTLVNQAQIDWTEVTLVGAIDAAIMAQNILTAAESVGLGGVYIGSVRNDIARLSELLQLPEAVVPVFGMCLGYPDQTPGMRPRLPQSLVISTNHYEPASAEALADYNEVIKNYYINRGSAGEDWVDQIKNYLDKPARPEILPYLNQQGYAKR